MTARTRKGSPVGCRGCELQQFGQRCGSRLMQRRAHRHFDGFQIQTARLALLLEDGAQESIYFTRDFLADGFGRFFSWALGASSSTGRSWQMRVLTATNS